MKLETRTIWLTFGYNYFISYLNIVHQNGSVSFLNVDIAKLYIKRLVSDVCNHAQDKLQVF